MSKTEPKPAKTGMSVVIEALQALSPAEREGLLARGFVMPYISEGSNIERAIWGYRCHYCDHMALEFVGDRFDNGTGEPVSKPPLNLTLDRIPWVQPKLPLNEVNRARPRCQHCGQQVVTARGVPIEKYIVNIKLYEQKRHAGFEALRKFRAEGGAPSVTHNTDGSPIEMSESYDADDRKILTAGALEKRGGIQREETQIERAAKDLVRKGDTSLVEQMAAKFNLPDKLGTPGR